MDPMVLEELKSLGHGAGRCVETGVLESSWLGGGLVSARAGLPGVFA